MRFKEKAEAVNVGGVQQRIGGMSDKNEGHHYPDDIEATVRIMRRSLKPISIHNVLLR